MSVLKAIGSFFRGCAVFVSRAFVSLVGHDAASEFAHGALAILKSRIGQIALTAVEDVALHADPNADPSAKRESALNKVFADAKNAGIQIAQSEANLLIETAYAAISGRFGVQQPKPAPQPNSGT